MNEDLKKEAEEMMDWLGEKNQTIMGLDTPETATFDVLLWLFGDGEKPDIIHE